MDSFDIPTLGLYVGAVALAFMIFGISIGIFEIVGYPLSRITKGLVNHIGIDFTWAMSPEEVANDINGKVLTWDMVKDKKPEGISGWLSTRLVTQNTPQFESATRLKMWRDSRYDSFHMSEQELAQAISISDREVRDVQPFARTWIRLEIPYQFQDTNGIILLKPEKGIQRTFRLKPGVEELTFTMRKDSFPAKIVVLPPS